jgi:hypothetical protein
VQAVWEAVVEAVMVVVLEEEVSPLVVVEDVQAVVVLAVGGMDTALGTATATTTTAPMDLLDSIPISDPTRQIMAQAGTTRGDDGVDMAAMVVEAGTMHIGRVAIISDKHRSRIIEVCSMDLHSSSRKHLFICRTSSSCSDRNSEGHCSNK